MGGARSRQDSCRGRRRDVVARRRRGERRLGRGAECDGWSTALRRRSVENYSPRRHGGHGGLVYWILLRDFCASVVNFHPYGWAADETAPPLRASKRAP